MTYIIGLKSHGLNSIISDSRVTYEEKFGEENEKWGENTYLKTGELFPGCIFGMVGNLDHAETFILSTKKHLALVPHGKIQDFWQRFEKFVLDYNFLTEEENHFQILLSCRVSGKPEFYLIDPMRKKELSRCSENWIKLGSGRKMLDERIDRDYKQRLKDMHAATKGKPNENLINPHLMCLWLTELSQSFERQELEDNYVGGVFHFIFQTSSSNHAQLPSVYVLLDINKERRTISLWYYRVCFVHPWLVIDTCIPPGQLADFPLGKIERKCLLAETALPPKKNGSWDMKTLEVELKNKLTSVLKKQPFYFFCGFGYKDPNLRKNFLFQLNPEGDDIFSRKGVIREDMLKLILKEIKLI